MNRFRPKPRMAHVTIAVALIGAAVTLALAIWESQKGKTQGPAIIDNQHASQGWR
jgi:heme A synthase